MRTVLRSLLGLTVALVLIGGPAAYYRSEYANHKRLRVVTEGRFYRSGQLTASGLKDAIRDYGIKCVINLQEEATDPYMPEAWLGKPSVYESNLCNELGVNYYALFGNEVIADADAAAGKRPPVIDQFLKILDDPGNYPVLIHCKAGLHRTGLMTAVYRMEFEQWPPRRAVEELRANGFGTYAATTGNVYLRQYFEGFARGTRNPAPPPMVTRTIAEGPR